MANLKIIVIISFWDLYPVLGLGCLRPADSLGRPVPFSCCGENVSPHLPSGTLAIITSYKFDCCGQIASWKTYVQPDGTEHIDGHYIVDLQVWRPSAMVSTDGCYSLVGFDRYSGVLGQGGLLSKVSKPSQRISFRPGDVIGLFVFRRHSFSTPSPRKGGLKLDTSYSEEAVWYHVNSALDLLKIGNESCPVPVGRGRMLKDFINAAPLLSLQTATFPCSILYEEFPSAVKLPSLQTTQHVIRKRDFRSVGLTTWRYLVGISTVLFMVVLFALIVFMAITALRKSGAKNIFPLLLPGYIMSKFNAQPLPPPQTSVPSAHPDLSPSQGPPPSIPPPPWWRFQPPPPGRRFPPGRFPPGRFPPGRFPPGRFPPGRFPPGPRRFPPGPRRFPPGPRHSPPAGPLRSPSAGPGRFPPPPRRSSSPQPLPPPPPRSPPPPRRSSSPQKLPLPPRRSPSLPQRSPSLPRRLLPPPRRPPPP